MFYYFITFFSIIFYNSLICLSFVIEILYFQTVPGTKHHIFMLTLTFFTMLLFFRHQKDSGRQSIYKGQNLYAVSCIIVAYSILYFCTIQSAKTAVAQTISTFYKYFHPARQFKHFCDRWIYLLEDGIFGCNGVPVDHHTYSMDHQ